MSNTEPHITQPTQDVYSAQALRKLCQRIVDSGVLGRSAHYSALLDYLVECAIAGTTPKEIELAVDGLGRGEDYDVANDSSVRVYMHQLRKKLADYYREHEPDADYELVIPKGQYGLAVASRHPQSAGLVGWWQRLWQSSQINVNTALLAAAIVLLLTNLLLLLSQPSSDDTRFEAVSEHPLWQQILADETPVMLVMGDYYIFGELNANGNIARMVREFNVNSSSDLEELRFTDIEAAENYLDLDLSYMPEGSAFALARIVPVLQRAGKPVSIAMMSDLTTADIRSHHIVYIGYISALDKLRDMTFAGSGLEIGRSYDELLNRDSVEYYTSDAGLPEEGQTFKDYGLFSTYPASQDTQVILVSGMRDAGLMHTAQALSEPEALQELVASIDHDTDAALSSFEALYEVYGVDRLNFDASLVYSQQLDSKRIWHGVVETGLNY